MPTRFLPVCLFTICLFLTGCFNGSSSSSTPANQPPEQTPPTAGSNASLASLSVAEGPLEPAFDAQTLTYTLTVPSAVNTLEVSATATDSNASVRVDNATPENGSSTRSVTLSGSPVGIDVVVFAENGETSRTYSIAVTQDSEPPETTFQIPLQVVNDRGFILANALIEINGEQAAFTDTDGLAKIELPSGTETALRASADGHLGQTRRITAPDVSTGAANLQRFALKRRENAVVLADAENGGSVDGLDGVKFTVPAGALVDDAGQPVIGAVDVFMSPVDISDERNRQAFPGEFRAIDENGESVFLVSLGVADWTFEQSGNPVSLGEGQTATIEIPLYVPNDDQGALLTVGTAIELWFLNEETGIWKQEGFGSVVDSLASPTGLALQAEVTHFSWWNVDKPLPGATLNLRVACNAPATDCDLPFTQTRMVVTVEADTPEQPFFASSAEFDVPDSTDTLLSGQVPANTSLKVSVAAGSGAWAGEVSPASIEVSAGGFATIDVVLKPTRAVGGAFTPGNPLRGFMTSVGETHDYPFSGQAGETFGILVFAAETVNSPLETTGQLAGRVSLLDAEGNELTTEVFDAFQTVRIARELPETADYTLRFSAEGKVPGWYVAQTGLLPPGLFTAYLTENARAFGRAVSADDIIVASAASFSSLLTSTIVVYEFDAAGGGWRVRLRRSKNDDQALFGDSLATDGDTVLVGAPGDTLSLDRFWCDGFAEEFDGSRKGAAYVFRRQPDDSTWVLEDCLRQTETSRTQFGSRVGLAGDIAVLGAPEDANSTPGISPDSSAANSDLEGSGAVYVYTRDANNTWTPEAYIKAAQPARRSRFGGLGVAFDGRHLIVTADEGVTADGTALPPRVHLFTRDAGNWTQAGVFDLPPSRSPESAALDEGRAVVGVPDADNEGRVYVFGLDSDGNWAPLANINAINAELGGRFGESVDLNGSDLLVGASRQTTPDSNNPEGGDIDTAGRSYLLRKQSGDQWLLVKTLAADFPDRFDSYGASVGLGKRFIAVGAPGDDGCFQEPETNQCTDSGGINVTPR